MDLTTKGLSFVYAFSGLFGRKLAGLRQACRETLNRLPDAIFVKALGSNGHKLVEHTETEILSDHPGIVTRSELQS